MSTAAKTPPRAQLLVVEDSSVFREMQGLLLGQAGFAVSAHENPQSALDVAAKQHFDLVLIDYELPEMNGEQFMHALRRIQPDIAVIFVSGSLTLELAIKLSHQGVAGIFNKPANPKTLLEKINETLLRAVRDTAARTGSSSPVTTQGFTPSEPPANQLAFLPRFVVGQSDAFREFTHRLWKVRDFRAALLLQGETGSPFELIARELAELSIFRDGPVMVCAAADFEPRHMIEVLAPSLLSHDAGTLVLTGVESFTLEQQKTLENLLSGRDGFLPFARRFRVILAATSALTERVDAGTFNETLFYKISSLSLTVPSLRETRGDIALRVQRILQQEHEAHQTNVTTVAADAAAWLEAHDWPGNYEELVRTLIAALPHAIDTELTVEALLAGLPNAATMRTTSGATPVPMPAGTEHPTGEARPPFPIQSAVGDPQADAVAATKPAAAPAVTLRSLFRPASAAYDFTRQLEQSLANAHAAA
jgi:DNA-binding NtrC family response regulator